MLQQVRIILNVMAILDWFNFFFIVKLQFPILVINTQPFEILSLFSDPSTKPFLMASSERGISKRESFL